MVRTEDTHMVFSNSSVSSLHAHGIFLNGVAWLDRKSARLSLPAHKRTFKQIRFSSSNILLTTSKGKVNGEGF